MQNIYVLLNCYSIGIINDVIRQVKPTSSRGGKWKILVVDSLSRKIINSCCKVHDILDENVTSTFYLLAPQYLIDVLYKLYPLVISLL